MATPKTILIILMALLPLSGCAGVTARIGWFDVEPSTSESYAITHLRACLPVCLQFDAANLYYIGIGPFIEDQSPYIGLIYWGER